MTSDRHGDERLYSDEPSSVDQVLIEIERAFVALWELFKEVARAFVAVLTEPYREFKAHGPQPFTSHRKRFLRDR